MIMMTMKIPDSGIVGKQWEERGEVKGRVFQQESVAFPDYLFESIVILIIIMFI